MPTIKSRRFGDLTVADSDFLEFPNGLIGFPSAIRFYLVQHKFPFFWLHSADDPEVAFALVESSFLPEIEIRLPKRDAVLALEKDEKPRLFFVLTMNSEPSSSTVNLKAPLAVNPKVKRGIQLVLEDDRYEVAAPLLKLKRAEKK